MCEKACQFDAVKVLDNVGVTKWSDVMKALLGGIGGRIMKKIAVKEGGRENNMFIFYQKSNKGDSFGI